MAAIEIELKIAPPTLGAPSDGKSWIFASALAIIFMAALEGTIVATAMPTIVGFLGGFDLFSWVFSAYFLTQAITIPIYGRLADIKGRKPILLLGIGLFLFGSLLSGFAWSMTSLIAFRIIQGLGAGSLVPIAQTIVGDIYSGAQRARMQGYVSSVFGSAAILGPTVGSFLVVYTHWSLVFWINIPVGIVAGILLAANFKEKIPKRYQRIDYLGAILLTLSTTLLMFALIGVAALSSIAIISLIVSSAFLFAVLLRYERLVSAPMLPIKLFRNRIVAGGNIICLANGIIMMGIVAFLPAYMQGVMGTSALLAGLALAAMAVAWPVGGFIGSRLMLWCSYRISATIGGVILVTGSLVMMALGPTVVPAWAITGALFIGFGIGITNICFVVSVQSAVDQNQRGSATSSLSFMRIVGQSLGAAIFGGMLNIGLAGVTENGIDLMGRMMRAGPRQGLDAAMGAFTHSLHSMYLVNGLLALVVLGSVLALPSGLNLIRQGDRHR